MPKERSSDPYDVLMLAVILQAAVDLHSSNPACAAEALSWLRQEGLNWCLMLGILDDDFNAWANGGFKLPPSAHRNWRYGPSDRAASQTPLSKKK